MKRLFCLALALLFVLGGMATALAYDDVFPEEAYEMLEDNPNAYILDCRTPCEWHWVGHPGENTCGEGSFLKGKVVNIPLNLWVFDPTKKEYVMEQLNKEEFKDQVEKQFHKKRDTIIIMCRSGKRSIDSAIVLEELGYKSVYNMVEGFEGGKDGCGYRTLDQGWKNKGLPYNYDLEGIWMPPNQ